MSHMQNQITAKQRGFAIDTNEGTFYVPGDVYIPPDWLADNATFQASETCALEMQVFEQLRADLRDYHGGRTVNSISVCKGYFARLSAPGYLDCTDWSCYKTLREAREELASI